MGSHRSYKGVTARAMTMLMIMIIMIMMTVMTVMTVMMMMRSPHGRMEG